MTLVVHRELNFNPRSREGSDICQNGVARQRNYFNPRSREGSDQRTASAVCKRVSFQSTLPRGERPVPNVPIWKLFVFQSTLPRGERHNKLLFGVPIRGHFNPRSREGSDSCKMRSSVLHCYFNPRSREGSDTMRDFTNIFIGISIHAPARGATSAMVIALYISYFNPRSREGSDVFSRLPLSQRAIFQSTLPRGERRDLHSVFFEISSFQSTLPRGERHFFSGPSSFNIAFQSTLPRGERRYSIRLASVTP